MPTTWHLVPVSEVRRGAWLEDDYAYNTVYGVWASNARGQRFAYLGPMKNSEAGARAVIHRIDQTPDWTPIGNDEWTEADPVYGSEEYERLDATGYFAARERMEDQEAEWGMK
jgi:hypothetical protein